GVGLMGVDAQAQFLSLSAEFQQPIVSHDVFNVLDQDRDGFSLTQCILQIEFHVFLLFPILVGGSRKNAASCSRWWGAATPSAGSGSPAGDDPVRLTIVVLRVLAYAACRR